MTSTILGFQSISKDMTKALAQTASQTQVKRDSDYYLANIEKVKTIDQFLDNRRLFSYAMKAFGLEDMTYAKAFVKKALKEGVASDASFANKLVDTRLKEFVTAFNFERRGEYATTFEETQQGTVDRYVRQTLEENAGQQNEGVRLALYFQRKAETITSPYQILADKALIKIVQTAFDLPAATSNIDIDKQADIIEARLPMKDLQDPKKVQRFLERFTARYEMANGSSTGSAPTNAILAASTGSLGVTASVLQALQTLKIGGR